VGLLLRANPDLELISSVGAVLMMLGYIRTGDQHLAGWHRGLTMN